MSCQVVELVLDIFLGSRLLVQINVDFHDLRLRAFLSFSQNVCGVPFQRFDAHVVIHLLLHVGGLGHLLSFFANCHRVKRCELVQLIHDIGLIVAQPANRVVSVMWVGKTEAA